jgi:hypothetical protein
MSQRVENAGRSPYSADEWAALNTGVEVPPSRTLSDRMNYPSMAGIVVATLLIAVPFVGFVALVVDVVMILRYVFGYRAPGSPQWSIHHPSPVSLLVVWVVAVCTVVVYPLAIYMTVRFIIEYRAQRVAQVRQCPRCAETVKAAALVCRYCGEKLDPVAPALAPAPAPSSVVAALPSSKGTAPGSSRRIFYVIGGLAAVAILGYLALVYAGGQVSGTLSTAAAPPCVIVAQGPLGRFDAYIPGATVAQCNAELASARENFGADSASSQLFVSHDVPAGAPDCMLGTARLYVSGLTSQELRAQLCK